MREPVHWTISGPSVLSYIVWDFTKILQHTSLNTTTPRFPDHLVLFIVLIRLPGDRPPESCALILSVVCLPGRAGPRDNVRLEGKAVYLSTSCHDGFGDYIPRRKNWESIAIPALRV